MANKRPFLSGYKTYRPEVEGYGNAREWRASFAATMNLDDARAAVGDDTPEGILGIVKGALWNQVVTAFRRLLMANHPDRAVLNQMSVAVATAKSKRIIAAYTLLKERYGM